MTNIIGHNGYYSCFYGHIKGIHIRKPRKRQYPYTSTINYRTVNSFYINSREAQLNNKNIFGHLGISILNEVLDISLPHGIVIDYAHVSLLRHFRDVTRTVVASLAPSVREKIDYSLRTQAFPHFFHRKMRGIEDFSFIKANELKNLLLYGFIPHFIHYLTIDQLCFLSLLIIGIRLLHADNVFKPITSTTANNLLCRYDADHHIYFFHQANLVLHLHQHFQDIYKCHDPLSSVNTFAQEDFIGYISKNKNGTTSFHNLLSYYYNIDVLLTNLNEKKMCAVDGPLDLFSLAHNDPLFDELFDYHQQMCNCNNYNMCIKTYRRCRVLKQIFHSLQYIKRKNTISYFVQYLFRSNQTEFGTIKIFFQHHGQTFALIQHFQVINAFSDYLKESRYYDLLKQSIDNFYFVLKKTNINRIVSVEKIQKHLIIFEDALGKSHVLTTPVSSMTEHD
ncbi:unnamed protein product [Rotaria sp. Silwood2]|nr:unnamed protein product [Rotaria sp. Silwood2]